ncbi:MAG: thioredoxin domain-containing protein, partial [Patescibacteria group bacterium]|nr:thioredoxin domain-containing protein [Patescibacteria group bacterium]
MQPQQNQPVLTVPMAIVIAAAIIGGALLYVFHPIQTAAPTVLNNQNSASSTPASNVSVNLPPITASDHILGNPNADIKIVEYSDPSCPYCKMFQNVMLQIMQTYGSSGKVAWVYREFPLDKPDQNGNILHPNAGVQANAFECAASVGGNAGFWAFEKDWFAKFPDSGADETKTIDNQQITQTAIDTNLNTNDFKNCVANNTFASKIDQ